MYFIVKYVLIYIIYVYVFYCISTFPMIFLSNKGCGCASAWAYRGLGQFPDESAKWEFRIRAVRRRI